MRQDGHTHLWVRQDTRGGSAGGQRTVSARAAGERGEGTGGGLTLSLSILLYTWCVRNRVHTVPTKNPCKALALPTEGTSSWPRGWSPAATPHPACIPPTPQNPRREQTWQSHALVKGPDPKGPSGDKVLTR